MGPGHSFLPGNAADKLARQGRCLRPPQSLVVSLLLSLVSTLLFSQAEAYCLIEIRRHAGTLDFHRRTCAPSSCSLCSLSRLSCNGHSLLLSSYLSRIGRIENPFCSACGHSSQNTSHLILHCPATDSLRRSLFGDSLSLYDLWSRPWGVARFWGSMVFRHAPILRKGLGNQQQVTRKFETRHLK